MKEKITKYKLQNTNKFQITMFKITNKKKVISHWSFVIGELGEKVRRFNVRLKASIPGVQTTFFESHNIRHFDVFSRRRRYTILPEGHKFHYQLTIDNLQLIIKKGPYRSPMPWGRRDYHERFQYYFNH